MTKPGRLRWGLLGTARINRAVIPPIRASKKSELLAVASRLAEKAAEYAATWGISHFYSSYEALLADPTIDVIYISLPNALHAEWSIKAMQMGKHVLCEKPITISTAELDAIAEVARKTGKVITEAFMYRHHPQTALVKQMVDHGDIGSLQFIRGSFCYINTRSSDPRFDLSLGGGSLWDIGCYPISYARYLTGSEPLEVFGHQLTGPTGIDLYYAGQLRFPNGVLAQFISSFITINKVDMEIFGSLGRITIPEPFKPGKATRIIYHREGKEQAIDIKGQELYSGEIEDIEHAILDGQPTRISLDDSRGNIATIEALYDLARESKPTSLL